MNICLDTRILEEIAAGNKGQKEWLIKTYSDPSNHLFLPHIALTEFVSQSLNKRSERETNAVIQELIALHKSAVQLWLIGTDINIATLAGKIQYQHRFGIGDCIIIATAKMYKCGFIRTDQKEFEKVKGIKTRW